MIRLVLSCGMERYIDPIILDAYDVTEGDGGWCPDHPEATVDAVFAEDNNNAWPSERHVR